MPTKPQRARSRTATLIENRQASVIVRLGDIDVTIPQPMWDAAVRDYLSGLRAHDLAGLQSIIRHIDTLLPHGVSA